MAELSKARIASLSQVLFYYLLFLYLVFSSGEQLYIVLGLFKPKLGHSVALLLLAWIILERRAWQLPQPLIHAFVLILGSLILSAAFGTVPTRSFGYIGVYLFNFCLYFFIPFQLLQTVDLDRFFRIYWSSFAVVGLYATLQVMLSIFGIYEPLALQRVRTIARGQAWTYEPSYYALYMIPYVMFHNGMALLREKVGKAFEELPRPQGRFFDDLRKRGDLRRLSPPEQIVRLDPPLKGQGCGERIVQRRLKLLGQNILMMISTSTGLLVSYPVFFISSLIKKFNPFQNLVRQKFKKALLSFFISLVAITFLFYEIALHSLFKFFYFGFDKHVSFVTRLYGMIESFRVFLKYPILGVGLGGVSAEIFQEESTYNLKLETLEEFESFDPTNCFTEVLASLGLVGLIAFIYLGIVFYRAFQEVIADLSIDLASKKMATALFVSLVVMIIVLQMNQGLFRPYVWIHAAVVYGYLQRLKSAKKLFI